MPSRDATTHWTGGLQDGKGQVSLDSSNAGQFDVSFPTRAGNPDGQTSPEELIAAATDVEGVRGFVAADSLGARRAGRIAFEIATAAGITSVLVDDQAIVDARRQLWDDYRIAVEHGRRGRKAEGGRREAAELS